MTSSRAARALFPPVLVLVGGLLASTETSATAAPADPSTDAPVRVSFATPGDHVFTVPSGTTRVDVRVVGGEGGATTVRRGGRGAEVVATLDVVPGQVLHAVVGSSAVGAIPGAHGGGAAGGGADQCVGTPGAGGGASDVRTVAPGESGSEASRVLVAGGGGGASTLGTAGGPPLPTYGGHRGEGGGSAAGGHGGRDGAPGQGGSSTAGQGSSTGGAAGTASVGGRGGVGAGGQGNGCGGGGGGGFGGGGGGAAGGPGTAGGGAGGGGSLTTSTAPVGLAKRGATPSVTFSTPGRPATEGPLGVTTTLTLQQNDHGGGIVDFSNCPTSCQWFTRNAGTAPGGLRLDRAHDSVLAWGTSSQTDSDSTQASLGVTARPPGAPAGVGEPFVLSHLAHSNSPTTGTPPTQVGLQATATVQAPAGSPAVFRMLGPDALRLQFLESQNFQTVAQCDPSIQVSATPCDDRWGIGPATVTTTAAGLTWHLEVLGWRGPDGEVVTRISTEETVTTPWELLARVTVDERATTSVLEVDDTDPAAPVLTLTTTPVPQTGGTVSFTVDGQPVEGCVDVPVDATDGTTDCTAERVAPGPHTFGGGFDGVVGYTSSRAAPVDVDGRRPQTIDVATPADVTYGDRPTLTASASSGLPVAHTSTTPDVCAVTAAGQVTTVGAGECVVTVSQAGDDTFAPASEEVAFTVARATLTVTADDVRGEAGEDPPALTATITGLVGDDDLGVVSGAPVLTTTATSASPPGTYPITVSVDGLSADDYTFVAVGGTLTLDESVVATTTTLDVYPVTSTLNRATRLTATVVSDRAGRVPTGTVSFFLDDSSAPLATAPLVAGRAAVDVLLPGGEHTVVAVYSGADGFAPSATAPPARADVACTRTVIGRHDGTLRVTSGVTCLLPGSSVTGSVTVGPGASVSLDGATVRGSISATSATAVRMCGTSAASVAITSSRGFVLVGEPGIGCAGNQIDGSLVLTANRNGIVAVGNTVRANVVSVSSSGAGPLPGQQSPVVRDNGR